MEILATTAFFIFGAIIGSFLNVVILRYNTGTGVSGHSHCFSCHKNIRWFDLVPILSFLLLGGHCRFCKSKISAQYPLVEFFTGLFFAGIFLKFLPSIYTSDFMSSQYYLLLVTLAIISTLVVITVYDLKHKIIPDFFALLFGILSLAYIFISVPIEILFSGAGAVIYFLSGPIIALPFLLLWLISRGKWIGLGDAKLALGLGWFLGTAYGISAVVIGFWIGAVVSVFLMGLSKISRFQSVRNTLSNFGMKNLSMTSEVPLAPFLIFGFLIVYFFQIDVMGLVM